MRKWWILKRSSCLVERCPSCATSRDTDILLSLIQRFLFFAFRVSTFLKFSVPKIARYFSDLPHLDDDQLHARSLEFRSVDANQVCSERIFTFLLSFFK